MDKQQAINIVKETFESPFEKGQYKKFVKNLLNQYEDAEITRTGNFIPDAFKNYVSKYERLGKYQDGEDHRIDILVVYLKRETSIEHARSMQRNFVAGYLQGKYGTDADKDAALVAFVSPNSEDWRFSLVKLDVQLETAAKGRMKPVEVITPARRWSFLVGRHEKSHTAQRQFVPIIEDDRNNPTLSDLEEAFNIEKVTKEFFEKYRGLFIWTKDEIDKTVDRNSKTKADFEAKGIDTVNFAKKLLGQIIFLYYLQKKGWFGVPRDADWGEGSRNFLRELFEKKHGEYENFFNDILEPLFYEALRIDRSHDDHYYSRFNCKIPFLNGGLFDPMNNYDWVKTDILIPNELFSNKNKTKEGDTGDGILDIFDRYNFTVKEDEPFEKEVAIDPELLGKAYEKFNAIRPDNYEEYSKALKSGKKGEETKFNKQYGVYYTPREIVHYMCQQSLINYLYTELNPGVVYQNLGDSRLDMFGNALKGGQQNMTVEHRLTAEISREDIAFLIQHGESLHEHDATVDAKGKETETYSYQLPEPIRKHASYINEKLATIKVCDPAVGSGAFPVGMMSEIVKARHVLETFVKKDKAVYDFKRECIENSLYGVDIDSGAVEIAKLRLWLSLAVDEDDPQNIKPLPNLDYKIVCGNSLIGFPENWGSPIEKKIEALIHQHFNETNVARKNELKAHIDEKIESRYKNSLKTFGYQISFDFKTVFSEVFQRKGGFDVVVANPPYVGEKGHKETFRELKKANLGKFYQGKMDLFYFFIHLAINLCNDTGHITFITTNYYITALGAKKLRQDLKNRTRVESLINFNELKLFENALGQHNMITILSKASRKNATSHNCVSRRFGNATTPILNSILSWKDTETEYFSVPQSELYEGDECYIRLSGVSSASSTDPTQIILEKINNQGVRLDNICLIKTGLDSAADYLSNSNITKLKNLDSVSVGNGIFVLRLDHDPDKNVIKSLTEREKTLLKPFFKSSDIRRYWSASKPEKYIIYFNKESPDITNFPNVKRHLERYKSILLDRREVVNGNIRFFELHWPRNPELFSGKKILVPYRANTNTFGYSSDDWYCRTDCYIIKNKQNKVNLKYLLAILNSRLFYLWFSKKGKRKGEMLELLQKPLSEVPVKIILEDEQQSFITLVDRVLAAKRANPQANISAWEEEIDQLVYQLYELTEDEIKIVEGKV